MKNSSTKIVLIVFLVLVVVVVLLIVGSGGCGAQGGGGGGTTGTTSTTATSEPVPQPAQQQTEQQTQAQAGQQAQQSTQQDAGSSDVEGAEPYVEGSYENMRDELLGMLNPQPVPTGANPRVATSVENEIETVAEVHADLADRGFVSDIPITTSYTIDGEYISKTELDPASAEKHPTYSTYYASKNDVLWMIVVNAGHCFAVPVAAKSDSASVSKEIILSEQDYVTQYDGTTNQYSDFAFSDIKASNVVGITVQRVDAATLDSYTIDDIERL